MLKLLILGFILYLSTSEQCIPIISDGPGPNPSGLPDFQAGKPSNSQGTLDLVNDKAAKDRGLKYNRKLINKFNKDKTQIGTVISYLDKFLDLNNFDFSINANLQSESSLVLVLFMSQTANWATLFVHYIVSSRDDTRVQNIVVNSKQILGPNKSKVDVKFSYIFGGKRPWKAKVGQVRSFISGIKYKGSFLNAQIKQQKLNPSKSTIDFVIAVQNSQAAVEKLQITYIAFTRENNLIKFQDLQYGVSDQSTKGSFQSTVQPALKNNFYNLLVGITNMNLDNFIKAFNNKRRVLAQIISSQFSKFMEVFQLKGIQFELMNSAGVMNTIKDGVNGITIIRNCVKFNQCLQNGGTVYYLQDNPYCINCRPHSSYNYDTKRCQCIDGFYLDKNFSCSSLQTLCKANEVYLNGNCYTVSSDIKPDCIQNEYFNKQKQQCQCSSGYRLVFRSDRRFCQLQCQESFILNEDQTKCICPLGTALSDKKCSPCHESALYNEQVKQCNCKPGFVGDGVRCVRSIRSPIFDISEFIKIKESG